MGKKQRKRRENLHGPGRVRSGPSKSAETTAKPPKMLVLVALAFLAGSILGWGVKSVNSTTRIPREISSPARRPEVATWRDLPALDESALSRIGLARMNLLCAEGLRGTEGLQVEDCLDRLDHWSELARRETARNLHRFLEHPEDYEGSEAYYRMGMLITVLQQDCGISYDEKFRSVTPVANGQDDGFFEEASRVFVHGLLGRERRGTCSSMPVLYAAVAQQLGYPVHLCAAKGHLFVRWEDGAERINFEGTNRGVVTHSDEHYRSWPYAISEEEVARGEYLKNLSGKEVLAVFLGIRASCLEARAQRDEALECFAISNRLAPHPNSRAGLRVLLGTGHPPRRHVSQIQRTRNPPSALEEVNRINSMNRIPASGPNFPGIPSDPTPDTPNPYTR